ncbi:hypothetical protein [Streptosporangium roseum]|uniref:hypothetical protein n=1 Tax=Streptosporangium roseum TaxID=2001 RepID=UPI0004CCACF9|nr:hypothetical protein [Streptosporangium roseum]
MTTTGDNVMAGNISSPVTDLPGVVAVAGQSISERAPSLRKVGAGIGRRNTALIRIPSDRVTPSSGRVHDR